MVGGEATASDEAEDGARGADDNLISLAAECNGLGFIISLQADAVKIIEIKSYKERKNKEQHNLITNKCPCKKHG